MKEGSLQLQTTYGQIWKIALPICLALLVPQINFITNNIFLGHYPDGGKSLSYAGIAGVYYLIFAGIGYGLNNGLQALISRRAGENKIDEIGRTFNHGVLIAIIIAAAGILITFFIASPVMKLVIRNPETYGNVMEFLKIRVWGLPFLYIYQMRNALLVGINRSKLLVIGTLAEAASNVLFDYLLIFGKFGFPKLGFNGAAIASIISEFTGMFVIFLVIYFKGITRQFSIFSRFSFQANTVRQISSMSAPLMFQTAISVISWYFFFLLVERNTGIRDQGITNTMRNIFGLFGILSWSFAATTNTMVSNVIGQGKQDRVWDLLKKIVHLSFGSAFVFFLLLNLFPSVFISVFGQEHEFTVRAVPVVRIVSTALLFVSVAIVFLYAVTGTGHSRMTFMIELVAIILYSVYVFVVLEIFKLGINIGWMSEWLYWFTLLALSYLFLKKGNWKNKII